MCSIRKYIIDELPGVLFNVQQIDHDGGLLLTLADQEEHSHYGAHLVPQEGLADQGDTLHGVAVIVCADGLDADRSHATNELHHAVAHVHLAKVAEIMGTNQVMRCFPHVLQS